MLKVVQKNEESIDNRVEAVGGSLLDALPKSAHPGAKAALAEIYNAEDAEHARTAVTAFEAEFGAKWPKAVA